MSITLEGRTALTVLSRAEKQIQKIFSAMEIVRNGEELLREALAGIEVKEEPQNQQLTKRELQVMGLIGKKFHVGDLAKKLGLDKRTVYTHIENVRKKLGFKSIAELRTHAIKHASD